MMEEKINIEEITDSIVGETVEKKTAVKNGVYRLVLAVLSILLEIGVIFLLLHFAGQKAAWLYHVIRFIALFLVLGIYGSNKTASIRMTWIMLILLLPIFGTTMYMLVGQNAFTWRMRKRYDEIDRDLLPLLPENKETEARAGAMDGRLSGLIRYIHRQAGYPVYENTRVTYYDDGEKGFEAQKRDLAKAEHFIFMEYHAIEDAECWHELQAVLEERARAGVEVRIFYDDMGSLGFINTDFVKRMEARGLQCRVFNPFSHGLNFFLNNRDHRKITVIDGKVGFTGGYNLANEYFHRTEPFGFWKDTGIRLEGDAVRSLTVTFLEMWNAISDIDKDDTDYKKYVYATPVGPAALANTLDASGEHPAPTAVSIGPKAPADTHDASGDQPASTAASFGPASPATAQTAFPDFPGFVQPYADSPMDERPVGEDVYISIADGARDYVWYITPYLIITDEMRHALSLAAKRGVDVRIITPGIPDKKIVYNVTRSYYNGLTRNGVRIYEFTPGFCHAKMCVSDDLVATCGTINMDYRSLYHHFENGCLYACCDAVLRTREDFEATFSQCTEVTQYYTSGRGAFLRFGQLILRLFAPLM